MLLKNMHLEENETCTVNDCDDELKMFKIDKSDCDGESRSLVYKIFRTTCLPSSEKCSPSLSDDSHSDFEDILHRSLSLSPSSFPDCFSPGDIVPENYSNVVEIPYSSVIKQEPCTALVKVEEKCQELRRSSRLQALQAKLINLDNVKQEENHSDIPESKGLKRRRRTLSKKRTSSKRNGKSKEGPGTLGTQKNLPKYEERKKNIQENSTRSAPVSKNKYVKIKSEKLNLTKSRNLKLKSMLVVTPTAGSNTSSSSEIGKRKILFPKFANVDPCRVLSTLSLHRNSREFLAPKKPIALFVTKNKFASQLPSENHQYYFKRMQKEFYYLRRKYPMLDLITLDNCYAMSGCSLKTTEIMLLDLISGQEMVTTSYVGPPFYPLSVCSSDNGFHVSLSNSEGFPNKESPILRSGCKNSDNRSQNSDKLFRIALVQALNVLNCEEESVSVE